MSKTIFVINGPNLNMLGAREPDYYGSGTLKDIEDACAQTARGLGLTTEFRQSNHEGELVDWIQESGDKASGVVLNPAAYGHTSIALHDAVRTVDIPVIEVHLSNIHAREEFRHRTLVGPAATGMICGLGPQGYLLAVRALADMVNQ